MFGTENDRNNHRNFKSLLILFILLGTFLITFYNCGNDGYGNLYYTAAIKSMTESWHNFFFVSFDPAGFVSVDKPPVALCIQVLFVKIFGFHSWSIMLPEALAAVGSVWILFYIVNRGFGFLAGIASASMLAFTPIFIAASRSNNPDAVLVLVMLLAVLEVLRAAEKGSLLHLLLAAVLVGVGFNTKMLVAFLIVPACIITYCFAGNLNWRKKIGYLALAAVALTVISFSWVTAVDLTPSSQRPYVGSSSTNSEINLAFGYNGLNRVFAGTKSGKVSSNKTEHKDQMESSLSSQKTKDQSEESEQQIRTAPSIFRMLNPYWAEQISWFLPMAVFGVIGAILFIKKMLDRNKRHSIMLLALWISWAGTMVLFFSFYRDLTHRYYLNIIAPGLAALGGIGVSCLIKLARQKSMAYKLLLSAVFITTACFHLYLISQYPSWLKLLWPFDAACILIAIILPLTGRFAPLDKAKIYTGFSVACLILLLIAPATWSSIGMIAHVSGGDAFGGPSLLRGGQIPSFNNLLKQVRLNMSDPVEASSYKDLEIYLEKNQNGNEYLASTQSTSIAENIIIDTGKPVMAIGGFSGSNPILTLKTFQNLIYSGKVSYFISNDSNDIKDQKKTDQIYRGTNAPIFLWAQNKGKLVKSFHNSNGKDQNILLYLLPS